MISTPILAIPNVDDPNRQFTITLDASKQALGAVLSQYNPKTDRRHIISYFSKKVPKHLKNWSATRLEFLALHAAILH